MDYALVFKWVKAFPGREAKALETLKDFRLYFDKLFANGKIAEPLLLMHVNDGMYVVRGEMEAIFDIINRDDFVVLVDKAMLVCEGFEFHTYFTGEMMEHRLELYTKAGKELNYI